MRFTNFGVRFFVLDMLKSSRENKDNLKVLVEKFNVGKLIFESSKALGQHETCVSRRGGKRGSDGGIRTETTGIDF